MLTAPLACEGHHIEQRPKLSILLRPDGTHNAGYFFDQTGNSDSSERQ